MQISIDARLAHYRPAGVGRYAIRLAQHIPALDRTHDYTVLHMRADRRWAGSHRPRPLACWTPCHHRLERWTLAAELARLWPDVHHSPDFIPPAGGYRRAVITVHDLHFLYDPQLLTPESRRYYMDQIGWAVRRADAILVPATVTAQELRERLRVPEDKLVVTPEAADSAFRPVPMVESQPILARYGLQPGYVLFVGTLEPRKNIPGLLAACQRLGQEHRLDPVLVIAGAKGWLVDNLHQQIAGHGLEGRVRLLGRVPDADLPALYSRAAVLALPSFYEGFGLPVLEAMACGAPVVASDRGSLPELVANAGLLVDPEDPAAWAAALALVLADTGVHADLRARGITRAAQFSWQETARKTLAVYQCVS